MRSPAVDARRDFDRIAVGVADLDVLRFGEVLPSRLRMLENGEAFGVRGRMDDGAQTARPGARRIA